MAEDFVYSLCSGWSIHRLPRRTREVVDVIENAADITGRSRAPDTLGVAAPDARTLVIRLNSPAPYLPGVLVAPQHFPGASGDAAERGARLCSRPGNAVSNGAFVLEEWTVGSHISRAPQSALLGQCQQSHRSHQLPADRRPGRRARRYRAGDLDITYTVPAAQFKWIRENLGAELQVSPQLSTYYYGFNLHRAPFKDNRDCGSRCPWSIDRERLTESVTGAAKWPPMAGCRWVSRTTTSQRPHGRPAVRAARRASPALYAEAGYSASEALAHRDPLQHRREPHAVGGGHRGDVEGVTWASRRAW